MEENINVPQEEKKLKLDYGKTAKIGVAFAIIILFWAAYDFVVPLLLENAYGLSNSVRGLIMGLDNLLSLFLLPLFGKISDKSKSKLTNKWGRRTPFIIIGTILAAITMIFVPIVAKTQQVESMNTRNEILTEMSQSPEVLQAKLLSFYGDSKYCDNEYLENNDISKEEYINISYHHITKQGFTNKTCYLDGEEITEEQYDEYAIDNELYNKFVASGMNVWISEQVYDSVISTETGRTSLGLYMAILFICLLAMAVFRSPAVALMPDVTPKPLRSQANAVINLAGGVGGALAFVIYTVTLFQISINNYIIIFAAVAGTMLLLLALFLSLVKERKMVKECEEICEEYGIVDEVDINTTTDKNGKKIRIPFKDRSVEEKAKFRSFMFILASIFMWFMGYNAVSTSLSIYCTKALNLSASIASIVSGVSMAISAIAFIPVGFLAVKIGRKKSVLIGFALATVSYILLLLFVKPGANYLVPAILFCVFYLISGFGLIITNVNTFPMVVELANADDVGKYTGYYYTATMSAQAVTPFFAGLVMDRFGMKYLFLYSAICVVIAIVFMYFVKHGDSKSIPKKLSKDEKKQVLLDSIGDAD
ncbi:MAG: MFS transporter [Clostridia bacterium]